MPLSPEAMVHSTQSLNGLLAVGEGSDAVLAQKCRGNRSPIFRGVPPPKAERGFGKGPRCIFTGVALCAISHISNHR